MGVAVPAIALDQASSEPGFRIAVAATRRELAHCFAAAHFVVGLLCSLGRLMASSSPSVWPAAAGGGELAGSGVGGLRAFGAGLSAVVLPLAAARLVCAADRAAGGCDHGPDPAAAAPCHTCVIGASDPAENSTHDV